MPHVQTVADFLLRLGIDRECPEQSDFVSPLRLQKLLYYAQGYALAALGRPLFHEPIRAWKNGPVVESVYHQFKHLGAQGIDPGEGVPAEPLTPNETDLLRMVWAEYGQYSANRLVAMTHSEQPWLEARDGLPQGEKCDSELSPETMAAFFRERLQGMAEPAGLPDPIRDWQVGEEPLASSTSFAEFRKSRRAPVEA